MAYGEFAPDCREIAYAAQDGEIRKMARFSKSSLSSMDRNPAPKPLNDGVEMFVSFLGSFQDSADKRKSASVFEALRGEGPGKLEKVFVQCLFSSVKVDGKHIWKAGKGGRCKTSQTPKAF